MSENIQLSSYSWTDSNNNTWPICNTKFLYGILGPTNHVSDNGTYYTASGAAPTTNWGSLNVVSVSQGNNNLVSLIPFKDTTGTTRYTISVNQSGIYRIKITLSFSGVSLSSSGVYYRFSDVSNNNI